MANSNEQDRVKGETEPGPAVPEHEAAGDAPCRRDEPGKADAARQTEEERRLARIAKMRYDNNGRFPPPGGKG